MAIIECPECGASVSDKAANCIKCGYPFSSNSRVIIYGYTQVFAINPSVEIRINGEFIGDLARDKVLEIPISENARIDFKCGLRKNYVMVDAGKITKVKITWNRITGQLVPKILD